LLSVRAAGCCTIDPTTSELVDDMVLVCRLRAAVHSRQTITGDADERGIGDCDDMNGHAREQFGKATFSSKCRGEMSVRQHAHEARRDAATDEYAAGREYIQGEI